LKEILELLENDARLTFKQLAVMIGKEESEVAGLVKDLEKNKIILGYHTFINWEKAGEEKVSAVIEVKICPQREVGFDAVAERIYRFPEVTTVRLVSGAYDLVVMVEGDTLKEVANFVSQKLATIEHVLSTSTHFVLKNYKIQGTIIEDGEEDRRLVITP